jgi:hypothetical protein
MEADNRKNFLFEDIILESHTYRISNFSKVFERYGPGKELTEEFRLCDNDWLFIFKPCDDDTEYVSAFISNLSAKSIEASYKITLCNSQPSCNIVFTDPEGMVSFDADCGGRGYDDTWGTDEFILSSSLYDDDSGFVSRDSIEIVIEMQIRGAVKSSATGSSKAADEIGMIYV